MSKMAMKDVLTGDKQWRIICGDCERVLEDIPDNSIDALVCDPPAGIAFMGQMWDADKGGRNQWVAWLTSIMVQVERVLKPGGHGFVWALPKTSHWTAWALESAGFEIREKFYHIFSTGFPKSRNISADIDKLAGAEREVVGKYQPPNGKAWNVTKAVSNPNDIFKTPARQERMDITAPATDAAKQWAGWHTGTKPAVEEWILIRKPISERNVALNVLKWGTGAINVGAAKIKHGADVDLSAMQRCQTKQGGHTVTLNIPGHEQPTYDPAGRWPSHLLFSHHPDCRQVGVKRVQSSSGWRDTDLGMDVHGRTYNLAKTPRTGRHYADADGLKTVQNWQCVEGCPILELDAQSGIRKSPATYQRGADVGVNSHSVGGKEQAGMVAYNYGDEGGASRFFQQFAAYGDGDLDVVPFLYQSKPAPSERNKGLHHLEDSTRTRVNSGGIEHDPKWAPTQVKNNHPTVKSVQLMQWLVKLITPPGGVVLDCFAGSGSTGIAATRYGCRFIGIEMDDWYARLAKERIANDMPLFNMFSDEEAQPAAAGVWQGGDPACDHSAEYEPSKPAVTGYGLATRICRCGAGYIIQEDAG
jgi:DNA modification methylase